MINLKRFPLKKTLIDKLAEYGLQNIPLDSCFYLHFSSGEEVLREGLPISWFYIITNGRAKVCRTDPNGKSLILCYYISDGMIGEIELMTKQEICTSTVMAITDFECIAIDYQNCMEELKTNTFFLNKIGVALAEKLSRSSDNFTSSALCTGEQRLCSYILQTSHHNIFNDILADVSCSIGLSYRHLFRLLTQLCEDKILDKRNSGYYILNRKELERRSHTFTDLFDVPK